MREGVIGEDFGRAMLALVDIVPTIDLEYVYPVESRVTLLSENPVEANVNADDGMARLAYVKPVDRIVRFILLEA
jgi:hypothetical protein